MPKQGRDVYQNHHSRRMRGLRSAPALSLLRLCRSVRSRRRRGSPDAASTAPGARHARRVDVCRPESIRRRSRTSEPADVGLSVPAVIGRAARQARSGGSRGRPAPAAAVPPLPPTMAWCRPRPARPAGAAAAHHTDPTPGLAGSVELGGA